MISNVAVKNAEATGSPAPAPGECADTGDSGAFDALLTLQSMISGDAASATVDAQLAGALEGAELPGTADDTDDSSSDDADALSFLAALLPMPQASVAPGASTFAAGNASCQPVQQDGSQPGASPGAAPSLASVLADTTADLAKAFASGAADAAAGDQVSSAPNQNSGSTPLTDKGWNSLTAPAELFAHGLRHGSAERAEAAPLTTHVRDPRWADDLGNRLASMVRTGDSSASLQLTPVDLGPLEVNVSVRDSQATVHFGAANAETRALLEASIPRLREMLAAQGFQLMDSSVSHGFAKSTRHEAAGTPRIDAIGESPTPVAQPVHITGLLDLYA